MEQKYFFYIQDQDIQEYERTKFFLKPLNPAGLCPFAAHSLYPYWFSFNRGSWFRWSESKDEVIAQCPHPQSAIAFKVTRGKNNIISAQVISKRGECLAGHQEGEVFNLSKLDKETVGAKVCNLNNVKMEISVVSHNQACRYYKKPGSVIKRSKWVPAGFCLPAYYYAYPNALSLTYDGRGDKQDKKEQIDYLVCPGNEQVKMEIKTQRNSLTPIMNLMERILRFIGRPKDAIDKEVKIKVIENMNCPQELELNQTFNFNLHDKTEICPAVWYNFFPYLVMLSKGAFPYWSSKESQSIDVHCPDAGAEIIHRINAK